MKYVLSDIHGNNRAWESIKSQIKLTKKDDLYILGDVIDRGEYGIEILQEIMHSPNMHMLLGNHEYMMMNALGFPYVKNDPEYVSHSRNENMELWFYNGGQPTYNTCRKMNQVDIGWIMDYLKGLPLSYEVEAGGRKFELVHANSPKFIADMLDHNIVKEGYELAAIITYFSVWDRDHLSFAGDYLKGFETTMVFGHTPTCNLRKVGCNCENSDSKYLEVFQFENLIGIDCGAGWGDYVHNDKGGRLSCVRLDDMQIFYSR